jgi:hypothetical protein
MNVTAREGGLQMFGLIRVRLLRACTGIYIYISSRALASRHCGSFAGLWWRHCGRVNKYCDG